MEDYVRLKDVRKIYKSRLRRQTELIFQLRKESLRSLSGRAVPEKRLF